jgi:hypothetical protein
VHDTVTDGVDVRDGGDRIDPRFLGYDPAQDAIDRGAVIPQGRVLVDDPLALGLEPQEGVAPDPLHQAAGESSIGVAFDPLEIGVDDLEPERGGAAVEDQYVDVRPPRLP